MTLAEIIEELRQAAAEDGMGRGACDEMAKALEAIAEDKLIPALENAERNLRGVGARTWASLCTDALAAIAAPEAPR